MIHVASRPVILVVALTVVSACTSDQLRPRDSTSADVSLPVKVATAAVLEPATDRRWSGIVPASSGTAVPATPVNEPRFEPVDVRVSQPVRTLIESSVVADQPVTEEIGASILAVTEAYENVGSLDMDTGGPDVVVPGISAHVPTTVSAIEGEAVIYDNVPQPVPAGMAPDPYSLPYGTAL